MNEAIFNFLYGFAHQSQNVDYVIIFLAKYLPYLTLIAAGIFLLMHHEVFKADNPLQIFNEKKKEILWAFFSGSLAWVLARILKLFIHHPRPFIEFSNVHALLPESGYAFPSGHATFYMALAVSIFLTHKKAGYVFMAFAVIIGIARVMAGVHFPVDILVGFILGALVAYFIKTV